MTVIELSMWIVTLTLIAEPGQRLVDGVVDDLVDEMMQARRTGRTDAMAGRLRTASSPSRTLILSAP